MFQKILQLITPLQHIHKIHVLEEGKDCPDQTKAFITLYQNWSLPYPINSQSTTRQLVVKPARNSLLIKDKPAGTG